MLSGVYARLLAAGAVLLLAALGVWWVYDRGAEAGESKVRAEWAAAALAAQAETNKLRAEGYKLAADYIVQLRQLETRHEQTNARLRTALDAPAVCPESGRLGDFVVPAAVFDSMFDSSAGVAHTPGPSASEPDRALR